MSEMSILVNIHPVNFCDVGCLHCIDDANMKNPIEMPMEYVQLLNKQLDSEKLYVSYCVTGNGEPLLHSQFNQLIDALLTYKRAKELSLMTAGYNEKETAKRNRFLRLLNSDYMRKVQVLLSFNLYADFPARWQAVVGDLLKCERDHGFTANICYSPRNREETFKSFNETIKKIAVQSDEAKNLTVLLKSQHPFCLRETPKKDNDDLQLWEREMLVNENLVYFLAGKSGWQFIGIRRFWLSIQGRAKKLGEVMDGRCDCPDFFHEFDFNFHLDPDGYWYCNLTCPKVPSLRLGHIENDSLGVIIRRKYFFHSIMTELLLMDDRAYDPHRPCEICQKINIQHGIIEAICHEIHD